MWTFLYLYMSSYILESNSCALSAVFPYTTLFRSYQEGLQRVADTHPLRRGIGDDLDGLVEVGAGVDEDVGVAGDRKSTRLYSSHVAISYTVFCWKKKKD